MSEWTKRSGGGKEGVSGSDMTALVWPTKRDNKQNERFALAGVVTFMFPSR